MKNKFQIGDIITTGDIREYLYYVQESNRRGYYLINIDDHDSSNSFSDGYCSANLVENYWNRILHTDFFRQDK